MKKFALIGEKVPYTYSPQIHKLWYQVKNINATYGIEEIPMNEFDKRIHEVLDQYDGVNITMPYKNKMMSVVDELDDVAKKIGAVNTVMKKNGKRMGYNTDLYGFSRMLDYFDVKINNKRVYIAGTGGASKSVFHSIKEREPKKIVFLSRSQTSDWIEGAEIVSYGKFSEGDADVVVNATPLGMSKHEGQSPLGVDQIRGCESLVDLIYNPEKTLFLKQGDQLGLKTVNGLYMLVAQAIKSEEIWNDVTTTEDEMNKIYQKIAQLMYN